MSLRSIHFKRPKKKNKPIFFLWTRDWFFFNVESCKKTNPTADNHHHMQQYTFIFFIWVPLIPSRLPFFTVRYFFSVSDQPHYLCINLSLFFLRFDSKRGWFFLLLSYEQQPVQSNIYIIVRPLFSRRRRKNRRNFILVALVFFMKINIFELN